jgi:hypothetical protein
MALRKLTASLFAVLALIATTVLGLTGPATAATRAYGHGGVDAAAFEARLAEIVEAIEGWPSVPVGPVEASSGHLRRVLGPGADG